MSELELFRQKHNLVDDNQGEFYTAIGPDGKQNFSMKQFKKR